MHAKRCAASVDIQLFSIASATPIEKIVSLCSMIFRRTAFADGAAIGQIFQRANRRRCCKYISANFHYRYFEVARLTGASQCRIKRWPVGSATSASSASLLGFILDYFDAIYFLENRLHFRRAGGRQHPGLGYFFKMIIVNRDAEPTRRVISVVACMRIRSRSRPPVDAPAPPGYRRRPRHSRRLLDDGCGINLVFLSRRLPVVGHLMNRERAVVKSGVRRRRHRDAYCAFRYVMTSVATRGSPARMRCRRRRFAEAMN